MTGLEFDSERVFRLVSHNRLLKKAYGKKHPNNEKNEDTLRSIFNALIVGDSQLTELYSKTA